MFDQEYFCSFDAAILGSYYGAWVTKVRAEGRIRHVPINPDLPVHTAWDLGRSDDTAIWFFQVPLGEIHILDHHSSNGHDAEYYIDHVKQWVKLRSAQQGNFYLPHDAKAKTFRSDKSVQELFAKAFGWDKVNIVPSLSIQDGIQAARRMFGRCYFDDSEDVQEGIEALAQYQREWDDKKKVFVEQPRRDWTSHTADAFRMLAVAYEAEKSTQPKPEAKFPLDMSIDQLIARQRRKRLAEEA
jgi:hypothetical protein